MQYAPNRNQAPLFSPIFSRAWEKIGPSETRQKRPRRNEPPQATSLFLCAHFFLSKPQTEFAVWVLSQICNNQSLSQPAADSSLYTREPWCVQINKTSPQEGADQQIRPAPSIDCKYSKATSCKFDTHRIRRRVVKNS